MSGKGRGAAWIAVALPALLACASALAGQEAPRVTRTGRGAPAADVRIDSVLAGGRYLLITHDTVISRADTVRGPVLALGAKVAVEGVIAGDLVGVTANLFLRPGAEVRGAAVNAGGGLYPSTQARILGDTVNAPLAAYAVERTASGFVIVGQVKGPPLVALDGAFGFHMPAYDRVEGLWVEWGARLNLPRVGRVTPFIHGVAGYRSQLSDGTGTIELGASRGTTRLTLGIERVTATPDGWVRATLLNDLSFLADGSDYRNYYDADRAYARFTRESTRGPWTITGGLRAEVERARSLEAHDPFVFFKPGKAPDDTLRSNPAIQPGDIASATGRLEARWEGASSSFRGGVEVEAAPKLGGSDFSFLRYATWGSWLMNAVANHSLEVRWRFQGPLPGTTSLPLQRWTFAGGSPTIFTERIGRYPGDRLAWVQTDYVIPGDPQLSLPLLGTPSLLLLHSAAMAWSHDEHPKLIQNVGVGIRALVFELRAVTNPLHPSADAQLDAGFSLDVQRLGLR